MAAKRKASTKKDLEAKIAELEAKLSKLSSEIAETKPAETKPAETKPAETKPAETKPAETAKPKPTLPKGTAEKPAEAPKPQESPKPAETTAQPPATPNEALESAYYDAPTSDFHQYRAKVTGYSPAPNRYFVRLTAPVGKATVTGYTACSNQYYATRARLAYHPSDKRFGSFSGVNMSFDGVEIKEQVQQAPPPPPPETAKPKGTLPKGTLPKGTLPKGMGDAPQPQTTTSSGDGKSRKEQLEDYEKDYLQRIEQEKAEREQAYQEALEAEVEARAKQTRGSLPKGF